VLVKNLENVQGDEREIIIFSPGVGRDSANRVTSQISSLNNEGGHRRLNVAITRARKELLVFSSLQPHEIDIGRTGARGVIDYKHFLEFAERGARAIAEAFAPTGGDTESPFEEAVKRGLEEKGWKVIPQIGVSFFRIDLGVVNPDVPSAFLAGVEADGAQYHSSVSARDRDLVRQRALEKLTWRIRRVWSTEWWMNPSSALEKLHERLLTDLENDRTQRAAAQAMADAPVIAETVREDEADAPEPEAAPVTGSSGVEEPDLPLEPAPATIKSEMVYARGLPATQAALNSPLTYEFADLASVATPDRARFYEPDYGIVLRRMVDHVIEKEAPVFFDQIVERVSEAHGFQRAGGEIRNIVRQALGRGRYPVTREEEREVIWPEDWNAEARPFWRHSDRRKHSDIPLPELASLAARLQMKGLDGNDLVRAIQEHFGLGRLAASTRRRFEAAVAMIESS